MSTVTTRAVPLAYMMLDPPNLTKALPRAIEQLSFGLNPHHQKARHHHGFIPQLFHGVNHQIHHEAAKIAAILGSHLLMKLTQLRSNCQEIQAAAQAQHQELERHLRWRPFAAFRRRRRSEDGHHSSHAAQLTPLDEAEVWCGKGDQHQRVLDLDAAAVCYEEAHKLSPTNIAYLVKLAKVLSDKTYEAGTLGPAAVEFNQRAMAYAQQAIDAQPHSAWGYIASCVSKGRMALCHPDNRTRAQLAKQAQDEARTALELDPSNDLAHHLMGRWHYEMANLNFVMRTLVRLLYGAAFAPGSYTGALECFTAAAGLAPDRLIHRVELARAYTKLGRKEQAVEELQRAMEMEIEDINAQLQRQDASAMLTQLQQEMQRQSLWAPVPLQLLLPGDQQQQAGGSGDVAA